MGTDRLNGKHFLVVDDEPMLREIVRFELESLGATVTEAANGRQAFELHQQTPADVIISDIRMPGGSGVELLDRVRAANGPQPIVVLMSAYSDVDEEAVLKKGAHAFYQKPCHCDEVVDDVVALLQERALAEDSTLLS